MLHTPWRGGWAPSFSVQLVGTPHMLPPQPGPGGFTDLAWFSMTACIIHTQQFTVVPCYHTVAWRVGTPRMLAPSQGREVSQHADRSSCCNHPELETGQRQ